MITTSFDHEWALQKTPPNHDCKAAFPSPQNSTAGRNDTHGYLIKSYASSICLAVFMWISSRETDMN